MLQSGALLIMLGLFAAAMAVVEQYKKSPYAWSAATLVLIGVNLLTLRFGVSNAWDLLLPAVVFLTIAAVACDRQEDGWHDYVVTLLVFGGLAAGAWTAFRFSLEGGGWGVLLVAVVAPSLAFLLIKQLAKFRRDELRHDLSPF